MVRATVPQEGMQVPPGGLMIALRMLARSPMWLEPARQGLNSAMLRKINLPRMGNYPVLDALYTLGFLYPPRADYFSREFARYVRLAQQQGWDLRSPKGSYAGAMGMGQFMPTSYLTWAQDFDGDGHKDLFSNAADAIGSVGFYLADHGWQENSPVALPARIDDPAGVAALIDDRPDLTQTWQQLQAAGVHLSQTLPANTPVKLLRFQQAESEEY